MRHSAQGKLSKQTHRALTGTWREEHLFVLTQSLALFDFYTAQIQVCDAEIERTYTTIRPAWADPQPPDDLPADKPRSHSKNTPKDVQVRAYLKCMAGVDLVAVHGISASLSCVMVNAVHERLDSN